MPDYSLCAYCYAPLIDGEMDHYDDCPTMTDPTDREDAPLPLSEVPAEVLAEWDAESLARVQAQLAKNGGELAYTSADGRRFIIADARGVYVK